MAAAVQPINHAAEGAHPVQGNAEKVRLDSEIFGYIKAIGLKAQYLRAQKELDKPWESLVAGACLIAAVATAIFCELAPIYALFLGIASLLIVQGIGNWLIKQHVSRANEQAANALLAPHFFETATQNASQRLASAASIIRAHKDWEAGVLARA